MSGKLSTALGKGSEVSQYCLNSLYIRKHHIWKSNQTFATDTCLFRSTPDRFTRFPDSLPYEMRLELAASVCLNGSCLTPRHIYRSLIESYLVNMNDIEDGNDD